MILMRTAVLYSRVSHFSDELVSTVVPIDAMKARGGVQVTAAPILDLGTRWCEWSGSRRDGFTPGEIPSIPIK